MEAESLKNCGRLFRHFHSETPGYSPPTFANLFLLSLLKPQPRSEQNVEYYASLLKAFTAGGVAGVVPWAFGFYNMGKNGFFGRN